MDNRYFDISQLLKVGLIALVVYFSQVYPYVHFHHAHDLSVIADDTGIEPVRAESHHSHHGHAHDHDHDHDHDGLPHDSGDTHHHHHHQFNQHVDWHLVRTYSQNTHIFADYISLSEKTDVVPTSALCPNRQQVDARPLPESVPPDGIDTRGPPACA